MRLRVAAAIVFGFTISLVGVWGGGSISSASMSRHCDLLSSVAVSGADLTIVGDVGGVAVGGNVERADMPEVQRRVELLREAGRDVCVVYRVRAGRANADPMVSTLFDFLGRLRGGDYVRVIWGGGGITVQGWLHDDSREHLRAVGRPAHPVNAPAIGRLDSLPLPVAMKVEFVTITPSKIVQFEQFHPRFGRITMETSSTVWLEACPGGWDGETPPDASWGTHWPAGKCVAFRKGTPAKLPDAWRNDMHLSVAVKAKKQVAVNVEVTLGYTAQDTSGRCFVAKVERPCQPFEQR
jgi:hypothetical protein